MARSSGACCPSHSRPLLDVLEEVPLDVVEANVWLSLPLTDRGSFRRVSHRSQRLADALQSSAIVSLSPTAEAEEDEARSAEHLITPWAAYLARLPHLSSLELLSWDSEADLQLAMLRFGAATRSRVASLELSSSRSPLTLGLGTGCALRLAFPRLETLYVHARVVELEVEPLQVEGAFFLPLQDVPLLELDVGNRDDVATLAPAALASLCGLTQLQSLTLCLETLHQQHTPLFTALSHLQHLSLDCDTLTFTAADAAPLFTLTRLTSLRLGLRPDDCGSVLPSAALHAPDAGGAPALGNLLGLQSLQMCDDFVADDGAFEQIRRLTRLTELVDCHIALMQPRPGSLPLLQQLTLSWIRPAALLQALQPLLPLPSLTALNDQYLWVELDVEGGDGGADARRQTAALKAAVQLLAAAPLMPVHTELALGCRVLRPRPPSLGGQLSLAQVVEGLGPWALPLTVVKMYDVVLDTFGGLALRASFPALRHLALSFVQCPPAVEVSHAGTLAVMDLAEHLTALERMDLVGLGVGARSAWLGVAAVRGTPLLVVVGDTAPEALVLAGLRRMQEERFGRQNVTWSVCSAGCEDGDYALL